MLYKTVTLFHTATHCNTLQHTAKLWNTLQRNVVNLGALPGVAEHWEQFTTHCNTPQHTATHRNTPQHQVCGSLEAIYNLGQQADSPFAFCGATFGTRCPKQTTATHYSTLQHTATHPNTSSILRSPPTHTPTHPCLARSVESLSRPCAHAFLCHYGVATVSRID